MADSTNYTGLITSEHNQRSNYVATVGLSVQPSVDLQNLAALFSRLFDIDLAVGDQLDKIGVWVGQSRNLTIPLSGVYFALDTLGVGLDEGTWFETGQSLTGLVTLPDDSYRLLLKAVIAANHWDGTVPGAYAIWAIVFSLYNFTILLQDNQDMSMDIIFLVVGTIPAVTLGLLTNGFLTMRPAGVLINGYWQPSVPGSPVFALDTEGPSLAGLDVGVWAIPV